MSRNSHEPKYEKINQFERPQEFPWLYPQPSGGCALPNTISEDCSWHPPGSPFRDQQYIKPEGISANRDRIGLVGQWIYLDQE
ncbi:hypothetical protein RRG08_035663 [Elysia crispata]|uniref:Uncharacterized protein n=1 Tax=Elysia crispata TaxID=231223 RepID=A0AAE0YC40_9GAST|nr:hypothetical protein RRG08_035663 [Elysia crispata]